MGDIKCLTAYKPGHPAVEHPITVMLRGRDRVLEAKEQQAHYKGTKKRRGLLAGVGAASGPRVSRSWLIPCFLALLYSWLRAPWQEVVEKKAVATSAGKVTEAAMG